MTAGGFYLMHRGWMDNPIFDSEPYTTREAWEWLIQRAAWVDAVHAVGRRRVAVKCGQLAVARRYLADRWQWSKSSTDRFLQRLVDGGMIDADARPEFTLITIRNYRQYQYRPEQDAAGDFSPETERGPQVGRNWAANRASDRASDRAATWAADRAADEDASVTESDGEINKVDAPLQNGAAKDGPQPGPQSGPENEPQLGPEVKCNAVEKRANYNDKQINKENNTSLATRAGATASAPQQGPARAEIAAFAGWLEQYLALTRPIAFDQIRLWLGRGVTLDQLRHVITTVTARNREGNAGWRPYTLRYFDDAIDRFRQNPTPVDPEESRWRMRLGRYKANGGWLPQWGDPPEQMDCLAPRALLVEFGFRQRA